MLRKPTGQKKENLLEAQDGHGHRMPLKFEVDLRESLKKTNELLKKTM